MDNITNVDESNEDVTYFTHSVRGYPSGVDVQVDDTGFVSLVQTSRSDFDDFPEQITLNMDTIFAIVNAYQKLVGEDA